MFVLSLTPTGSPEAMDRLRPEHLAWVAKGYADGLLLASGRLVPPTGGLMLARQDREAVDAFVDVEPFARAGLAGITVTEVRVMSTAPGLEALKDGQQG